MHTHRKPTSTYRVRQGRIDLIIIVVAAVVLAVATIAICLHLFKQSEDHVTTVRKTNVSFAEPMQFRSGAAEGDELVRLDLEREPRRRSAKYTRMEFSEQAMRYISKMHALNELSLRDTSIEDDWLVHLENLPLIHLSIYGSKVTDEGMKHLAKISTLRSLNLTETDITDEGIRNLKPLRELTNLNLTRTKITNDGARALKSFRHLRNVDLENTKVTAQCFQTLIKMKSLGSFSLADAPLTEADLRTLNRTRLHRLHFNRCELSDEDLHEIANFEQNLTKLDLSKNAFTDKGIGYLAKRKDLVKLVLKSCPNVTAEGVKKLQAQLPRCEIDYSAEIQKEYDLPPQIKKGIEL